MENFPHVRQLDSMDCGPACLKMIAKHFGQDIPLPYLRDKCHITKLGVSALGILKAAETIELKCIISQVPFAVDKNTPTLETAPKPVIAHWNQNHFVVIYKMTNTHVWIADPAASKHKLTKAEFMKSFASDGNEGIIFLFEPTVNFQTLDIKEEKPKGLKFILNYLSPHTRLILNLILGLVIATGVQLILPFLTQSLVDIGIDTKNLDFITLILIASLAVNIFGQLARFLQSWIILEIGTRINVSLVSDFLFKLMKLPLYFFESKNTGDLIQRINDQRRIESFLTNSLLSTLLSILNLFVFGIILVYYSTTVFLVFLTSSILYIAYIAFFLKYRKDIDYKSFRQMSDNQDTLIELIQGMPEVKLQGSQQKRRMKWASIQAKLYRLQRYSLTITQLQDGGANLINQTKDILISVIAATEVVEGRMTLGMLLAIQYIIGQLNGPIQQLIGFLRSAQDAKISLDRLAEVNEAKDEEDHTLQKMHHIPSGDIEIQNLSFQYTEISDIVLQNVSFTIPRGKTTAIVGSSGSGKTTLVKLLLRFYPIKNGTITIGSTDFTSIHLDTWRQQCGSVLQDGFLFSDTIADNIAESDDHTDAAKVQSALQMANIEDFVKDLPLQWNTMIGSKGNGVSQGQKQRLFIARALYKNPDFLFFDEATNSLDATNEKEITEKLQKYTQGKTTIVVAHRLSTVKNADQIIVLDKGKVVEIGTHISLVALQGHYYTLVKNQLELGQ